MKVAKWGNSLAVRIPKDVAEALGLEDGDEVDIRVAGERSLEIEREPSRQELIARIRRIAKPLPADWKFDRDEANAR